MSYTYFVVGSINMDLVTSVGRFPKPGETIKGSSFFTSPGGKGGNQACALARLGAPVHMVGKVGNDSFAEQYLSYFKKEGIDISYIKREESVATGIAVIEVEPSGENHIVLVPGANDLVDPHYSDTISPSFDTQSIVLLQLEIPTETVFHTLKAAKEKGAVTILDPAPAQVLPEEFYSYIDYLTPNSTEISVLSEMPADTDKQLHTAADHLLSKGARTIIAKRGERGASVFSAEEKYHVEGFSVHAVDTTAAGDSFNAGLAYGLGKGFSLKESVRFANAVGALSTLKMGAQTAMPSVEAVHTLMAT